ncbi:MAG: Zn-ribbon domain-containing OB-fold protein, partial [Anaerolineales bacterium]
MEIPRHWRIRQQRYALVGEVCPHCNAKLFPPRDVCPECGQDARVPYQFSGKGEIYSYTTIYEPPAGFEEYTP